MLAVPASVRAADAAEKKLADERRAEIESRLAQQNTKNTSQHPPFSHMWRPHFSHMSKEIMQALAEQKDIPTTPFSHMWRPHFSHMSKIFMQALAAQVSRGESGRPRGGAPAARGRQGGLERGAALREDDRLVARAWAGEARRCARGRSLSIASNHHFNHPPINSPINPPITRPITLQSPFQSTL